MGFKWKNKFIRFQMEQKKWYPIWNKKMKCHVNKNEQNWNKKNDDQIGK